jgi:hypothetical protein
MTNGSIHGNQSYRISRLYSRVLVTSKPIPTKQSKDISLSYSRTTLCPFLPPRASLVLPAQRGTWYSSCLIFLGFKFSLFFFFSFIHLLIFLGWLEILCFSSVCFLGIQTRALVFNHILNRGPTCKFTENPFDDEVIG